MDLLSPILILLSVTLYALLHSLLATLRAKAQARKWFGSLADRAYRLIYNLIAGLTFLPILALLAALPDRKLYVIPFPWVVLTSGLQLFAILGLVVALLQTGVWSFFGLRQIVSSQSEEDDHLVLHGLYRWVRHPLYTTGLIIIWLLPVMTVNLLALNVGLSAYLVIGAYIEERRLVKQFGQIYKDYQERVPMLTPFPPRRRLVK